MSRWMTAGEAIRMGAYLYPEKPGAKDLVRSLTFREWNERCCRLANGLLDMGLSPGDRFAVIAYNCLEWMEIYGGAAKAGLVVVPIMFRLTPNEYLYILENSESKAFLAAAPFHVGVDSVRAQLDWIPESGYVFFGEGETPPGYLPYEALLREASPEEPDVKVRHSDPWVILYTSGTTGKPKGVVRSHESLIAQYLIHICEMGIGRDDIGLMVMPMCHGNSVFYSFMFTFIYGAVCVYGRPSFDPEHLLETLVRERITFTSLVPTHYIMILALPDEVKNRYDLSCVRTLLCSSAPVRRDTKMEIMNYFKNSRLFEGYGSTEAGVVTLLRPEDQMRKLGSIGREIIGTDRIKLLDENGDEAPDGEVGELYSRSPMIFQEYWRMPRETRDAFRGEWFSAGDMARRDEDGFYTLVDRKKNMIITGGENVYPSEVEQVIGAHPKVKDAAAIGAPDLKWGEAVTAVVILHDGVEPGETVKHEILEWCRDKMAGYKRPKALEFIREEDMPRTATGKILHRVLRERYGMWSDHR